MYKYHIEFKLQSRMYKNRGYNEGNLFWQISLSKDTNDTFISNAKPEYGHGDVKINILFEGKSSDIPNEILDNIFCTYENGDGYWFRLPPPSFETCAGYGEDAKEAGRKISLDAFMRKLENPEVVFIYELIY